MFHYLYLFLLSWNLCHFKSKFLYLGISKNRGIPYTPKSSILIEVFHYFHHPFSWFSPYFWFNIHLQHLKGWKFHVLKIQKSMKFLRIPRPHPPNLTGKMCWTKNRGILPPKMDGENNGSKPYEQMDDLGGKNPLFLVQHPNVHSVFLHHVLYTHIKNISIYILYMKHLYGTAGIFTYTH